jgi:hypothetical protein
MRKIISGLAEAACALALSGLVLVPAGWRPRRPGQWSTSTSGMALRLSQVL